MIEVLAVIVPVFGLIALGFGAARIDLLGPDGLSGIRAFLFYLALPALIFQLVSTASLSGINVLGFALTETFATYCAFAIGFSIAALLNHGNVPEATVEGLAGADAQVPLMGPALVLAAFGTVAAAPMAVILAIDGAMLATMTPLMMALGGSGRNDPAALAETIARKVALNPLVLATLAGLIAAAIGFRLPGPFDALLTWLRQAAPPLALFALGAGLPFRRIELLQPELPLLLAVKLLAHPLIVYLLLTWVGGFDRVWIETAVLLAALPTTAEVLSLARNHRASVDRISAVVLLGTAVSIATVTVLLILLIHDILPVSGR